jgi:hypothetical protein
MAKAKVWTEERIKQLKAICRLKPTLKDCAAFLDIHPRTVETWIRETYDQTFTEFRDQNMVHTRFMIIRKIIEKCSHGDKTMLIWASKNLCGWSDKLDSDVKSAGQPIQITYVKDA